MSTLNVSNISDGTTSVGTGYVVNGSAKAWVNYTGVTTTSINDSFNTSSLTDVGTGRTTVTFSNSFDNANYCMSTSIRKDNDIANGTETLRTFLSSPKSVSSLFVVSYYNNPSAGTSGYFNSPENGAHFMGDLA